MIYTLVSLKVFNLLIDDYQYSNSIYLGTFIQNFHKETLLTWIFSKPYLNLFGLFNFPPYGKIILFFATAFLFIALFYITFKGAFKDEIYDDSQRKAIELMSISIGILMALASTLFPIITLILFGIFAVVIALIVLINYSKLIYYKVSIAVYKLAATYYTFKQKLIAIETELIKLKLKSMDVKDELEREEEEKKRKRRRF